MPLFDEIKENLLLQIYKESMQPDSKESFTADELSRMINQVGPSIAKAAIRALHEEASIEYETDPDGYTITSHGIRKAELVHQEMLPQQKNKNLGEQKQTFKEFKDSLLIELAKADQSAGGEYFDLKTLADNAGLSYQEGWVRKAGNSFKDYGLINDAFSLGGGTDGNMDASLTAEGLELAEELMATPYTPAQPEAGIPASDRIVKRSDNEEPWFNAIEGAKKLYDALKASNDHSDLTDEEFEQKLSEVRALQIMLDAPQIQWDVLNQFAETTVKYLAQKFAENAIGHAASALIGYLSGLLQGAF